MKEEILKCCKVEPALIVEYNLGSLGTRKYRVCDKHINTSPWNMHIISTKKIGDN